MKMIPTISQVILPVSLCLSLWAGGPAWAGVESNFVTLYGNLAGSSLSTGYNNTFIGVESGYATNVGHNNTFVGRIAGKNNTGNHNTFLGSTAGWQNTTGGANTFLGSYTGYANTTGSSNTFLGKEAGLSNTTGGYNTFLGLEAGRSNTTGTYNTFVGRSVGYSNTTGYYNTFLGMFAGQANTTGTGNVFLGNAAGYSETGSHRLYIDNSAATTPLIYGEFDTRLLKINGNLEVIGPNSGLVRLTDVTTDLTTKGARLVLNHYNNASLPVYLFGAASTPSQNFVAFGGGNAIGNAATQLDFFTAPTTTTAIGTSRMTITGSGNVGVGVATPVYPLQMASGALVTSGGVWTNASSREYKENIQSLSNKDAQLTLAKLNPVTYNYKLDNKENHVGFIAEDVPDLVATQDRKGLSPMDIVAVLTKVVQEQQRNMQEQQKTSDEQQRTIESLQGVVQAQNSALLEEQRKASIELRHTLETELKLIQEKQQAALSLLTREVKVLQQEIGREVNLTRASARQM